MKKGTLERCQKYSKSKKGKCLSNEYINSNTKIEWQCDKGHTWFAKPIKVLNGTWCPECSGTKKRSIEEAQKVAKENKIKCLSGEYVNNATDLEWQCDKGHTWFATLANIKKGTSCPYCNAPGIREHICRELFKAIFKKEFPKERPSWLVNSKDKRLELDGYNSELKLAFEHQGQQHYKENKFFSKNTTFDQRTEYDLIKRELCKKRGIVLIEIPYSIKYEELQNYIISECKKNNVAVPKVKRKIDYLNFNTHKNERLEKLKQIAKQKGGTCLSNQYIDSKTPLKFVCSKGHHWYAIANQIDRMNQWCRICSGYAKLTIEEMKKIAKKNKGLCLSNKYIDAHTNLRWQCKNGHEWYTAPSNIKHGTWCEICKKKENGIRRRLGIEAMQGLAKSKNGKCLSKEYLNKESKLQWQCDKGHTWYAIPGAVKRGTWCPICGQLKSIESRRLGLNYANKLAKKKGGQCLSKKYINTKLSLIWLCKNKHTFEKSIDLVKRDVWCPHCKK